VLRIVIFAIAVLIVPATASKVDASYCGQVSELAAARLRWAATRESRVDPAHNEKSCRACDDRIDHQRALDVLDAEIDAFNNLIATQCNGS